MTAAMYVPRFHLQQKLAMTTDRHQLVEAGPDGAEGRLLGFAQQKRLAFTEEVTFDADQSKAQPVFSFKARKRLDLHAGYDVHDAAGTQIGSFRKDFGASTVADPRVDFRVAASIAVGLDALMQR